ncbi:MAG: CBS domain-containing protein [Acidimicrobiia bacterium]|nr:CBS domain-containing protein [Acidimicrobiia bacterium]
MDVRSILAGKGNQVAVIGTDATIETALEELAHYDIGALVISNDGDHIAGILSERDVARGLREHGAAFLDRAVGDVMTTEVTTCGLDASVPDLMAVMTEQRARHLPVVHDDRLVGLVSIGDVVKRRLDELETLTEQMVQYIQGH